MSKNGLRVVIRFSAEANSKGRRCQCTSKQGWNVCRLHGADGGALAGAAHPNYRHGLRSQEMRSTRRLVSLTARFGKAL